jgi:hypothetical protein
LAKPRHFSHSIMSLSFFSNIENDSFSVQFVNLKGMSGQIRQGRIQYVFQVLVLILNIYLALKDLGGCKISSETEFR